MMRRGRWLYHHDQYRPQSPVFQVKDIAVRITAWVPAGVEPQVQVLIGDNPDDANARWVDMRMNGQTVTLGNPYATQVVIAQAGWYRIDTDDLVGRTAFVWVEDEPGTTDTSIVPVHIVRPSCNPSTPPPLAPVINITCSDLQTLVTAGNLQVGAWYRVTGVAPGALSGLPFFVYLHAVGPAEVTSSGWLECDPLTVRGLWPCKVRLDDGSGNAICELWEVHDLPKNNIVRSLQSLTTWPFLAPAWTHNVVEGTDFTFTTTTAPFTSTFMRNRTFGGAVRIGDHTTVYACRIEQVLLLYADPDPINGLAPSISNSWFHTDVNARFTGDVRVRESEFSSSNILFTPGGVSTLYAGRNARLTRAHISGSSVDVVYSSTLIYGTSFVDFTVKDGSIVALNGFATQNPTQVNLINFEISGRSSVTGDRVGVLTNVHVRDQSQLRIFTSTPVSITACSLTNVEVADRSYMSVHEQPLFAYFPRFDEIRVTHGSRLETRDWFYLVMQRVSVDKSSSIYVDGTSGSLSGVSLNDVSMSDGSQLIFHSSGRSGVTMFRTSMFASTIQPLAGAAPVPGVILRIYDCQFASGSRLTYNSGSIEVTLSSLDAYGGVVASGRVVITASEITRKATINANAAAIGSQCLVLTSRVSGSSQLDVTTNVANTTLEANAISVEDQSSLSLQLVSGGNVRIMDSTFSAGSSYTFTFNGPGLKTIEGLYSFGTVTAAQNWTASFTGANTRNF